MKSYNNLYSQCISSENVHKAIMDASKGKRNRAQVRPYIRNPKKYYHGFAECASEYTTPNHIPKTINDGISRKQRTIIVPYFYEQVVHHMVVNILKPIFMKGMYEHSYASIPNRGLHKAKKFIKKWIKNDPRHTKYFLKMDIRKYFESIPHDILLAKLHKVIRDKKFMALLEEIIKATPKGLPLGFHTSQWLANWYLQDLDHYIKEQLGATYYVRYMDDMVVLGSNKRQLHKMRVAIAQYLSKLGLQMKNSWVVSRITNVNCLDFMGFKFFKNRVTLRRRLFLRMCRKARRVRKKIDTKKRLTIYDTWQMLSYLGWIKAADVYGAYLKHIKTRIKFQYLKRKVSAWCRKNKKKNRKKK